MYKPLLIVCFLSGFLPLSACQLPVSQSSAQAVQTVNFLNLRVEEIGAKRAVLRFETSREMTDGSSSIQSIRLILNEGEQVLGPFLSPDPSQNYLFALNSSLNITGLKIETVSSSGGNNGAREIRFYTK